MITSPNPVCGTLAYQQVFFCLLVILQRQADLVEDEVKVEYAGAVWLSGELGRWYVDSEYFGIFSYK